MNLLPEWNVVLLVGKCDDPFTVLLWYRKQVLEDAHDPWKSIQIRWQDGCSFRHLIANDCSCRLVPQYSEQYYWLVILSECTESLYFILALNTMHEDKILLLKITNRHFCNINNTPSLLAWSWSCGRWGEDRPPTWYPRQGYHDAWQYWKYWM